MVLFSLFPAATSYPVNITMKTGSKMGDLPSGAPKFNILLNGGLRATKHTVSLGTSK